MMNFMDLKYEHSLLHVHHPHCISLYSREVICSKNDKNAPFQSRSQFLTSSRKSHRTNVPFQFRHYNHFSTFHIPYPQWFIVTNLYPLKHFQHVALLNEPWCCKILFAWMCGKAPEFTLSMPLTSNLLVVRLIRGVTLQPAWAFLGAWNQSPTPKFPHRWCRIPPSLQTSKHFAQIDLCSLGLYLASQKRQRVQMMDSKVWLYHPEQPVLCTTTKSFAIYLWSSCIPQPTGMDRMDCSLNGSSWNRDTFAHFFTLWAPSVTLCSWFPTHLYTDPFMVPEYVVWPSAKARQSCVWREPAIV